MKNEKKQKKEYSAPKMKPVKLRHKANLLQDSCPGGNCGLEGN